MSHVEVVRLLFLTVRLPGRTLAAVVAMSVVAAIVGSRTPDRLSNRGTEFLSKGTQSYRVAQTLAAAIGPLASPDVAVILPQSSSHAQAVLTAAQRVATIVPFSYHSQNKDNSLIVGYFHHGVAPGPAAVGLARELRPFPGVLVGGSALVEQELADQTKADVATAEVIAFPVLLLLALFVFRSVIAALLPVLTAGIALSFTLVALEAINAVYPVSILSLNLVVGLSVGLALDYSLLLLSRYREELSRGATPRQAAISTVLSAGRTVAISSATVAVAFASPLVFPIGFARSLAIGGMVAALVVGLVSLIVMPAIFSLLGRRIDMLAVRALRPTPSRHGVWSRIAQRVVARPVLAALAAVSVLAALSTPALGVRLTGFTAGALPANADSRLYEERVRREFPRPLLDEVVVLARGEAPAIRQVVSPAMEKLPDVAAGVATHVRGDLWVFDIKTRSTPFSRASQDLVREIRSLPLHLEVTGTTANYMDAISTLRADAPFAAALMIGLTLILLFAATGSAILPFAAVAMNILSFASAFGLVVLIFQHGRLTGLLDYRSAGALLLTQPVLLGAGAFGILTDYGVFMLTRIREGWDSALSNTEAVAQGMERTGPIISSAAILFCTAVGALLTAKMIFVKELGFGIVAAVTLDVTVVRALLLPGLMILLGRWSWWRPRALSRMPRRVRI